MGFKMNGSPAKMGTIQGTAGHSSALKMKVEEDASALKQMELTKEDLKGSGAAIAKGHTKLIVNATGSSVMGDGNSNVTKLDPKKSKVHKGILETRWKKGSENSGGSLNDLVKQRKGLTKGTAEYAEVQNKINKALGSKKVHKATVASDPPAKPTKVEKVEKKGEVKKAKITAKATKKTAEVDENVDKKTAKITRKIAKKTSGKGSIEHLQAKKAHLEAKEADRQGEKGGKKQSIFRRISSKINLKRQKKVQKKIDAKETEENA